MTATDVRSLAAELIRTSPDANDDLRLIFADALADAGFSKQADLLRNRGDAETIIIAISALPLKVGRKSLGNWLAGEIRAATRPLFEARRDRHENPDGEFDKKGRWYPSFDEDCGDFAGEIRAPTAAYPYSFMYRARTREHCRLLVINHLVGFSVPKKAADRAGPLRRQLIAILETKE